MKTLYYIGIENESPGKQRRGRVRKQPVTIYRHERQIPLEDGSIRLYHSLLPSFFEEEMRKRRWRKKWMTRLKEAEEYAREKLNAYLPEETVFSEKLCSLTGREREIPLFLFAAGLKKMKEIQSFAHISISLPKECGPAAAENMVELLQPYLSRVNYVVFVGEESESAGWVEDYLYDEYGIIMTYGKKPEKNAVWIDMEKKRVPAMEEFAACNGICHLCREHMLKFLDTVVKNEYNSKIVI